MSEKQTNPLIVIGIAVVVCLAALAVYQWYHVRKAHSSFENYYRFRGCQKLLEKTDTYATCQIGSGQVIKIVQAQGGWYLDGDLPCPGPKLSAKYLTCAL